MFMPFGLNTLLVYVAADGGSRDDRTALLPASTSVQRPGGQQRSFSRCATAGRRRAATENALCARWATPTARAARPPWLLAYVGRWTTSSPHRCPSPGTR